MSIALVYSLSVLCDVDVRIRFGIRNGRFVTHPAMIMTQTTVMAVIIRFDCRNCAAWIAIADDVVLC